MKNNIFQNDDQRLEEGHKPLRDDYKRKPKNAKQWANWSHQDDNFDEVMNQFIDEENVFYDYH